MAEELQNDTRTVMIQNNDSSSSDSEILQSLNDFYTNEFLPAVILVVVFIVVGIIGNGLVCYVYGFRLRMSIQHFLFLTLAAFDLLTCGVVMPADIAEMRNFVMFESEAACRLYHFVSWFTCMAPNLVLILIAVDRYMKICRPLSRQMSLRQVKMAVVAVLFVAGVFACPMAATVGIQVDHVTLAHRCSTDDRSVQYSFRSIYIIVIFVLCVCVVVVLSVLYVLIWRAIKQLNQRRTPRYVGDTAASSVSPPQPSLLSASPPQPSSPLSSASAIRFNVATLRTRKTVATAFAVTLTFILSYIPFFALATSPRLSPKLYKILIKSPYLNAVANPFIYSVLNPAFRAECFKVFAWIPFCCKCCRESRNDNQAENDNESR